jgi:hypothetical protein
MLLLVLLSNKSRKKHCFEIIWCANIETQHSSDTIQRSHQKKRFVKESSPKSCSKHAISHVGYPIDISTITRTLPTIPECLESYSYLNFAAKPTTTPREFIKSEKQAIFRTPSDVPRTAELIEMSSGPGKTVTEYTADRSSRTWKTGTYHFISGITPIKDTTYCSTDILSYNMTSEIVLNSASYMPSSAGVNLCILSPDYNSITKKRNILVFSNRKVTRELSSTFNNHSTSTQEQISSQFVFQTGASHRMNTTPASPMSHIAMTPASLPISGLANSGLVNSGLANQHNPNQMQAVQVSHIQNQIQPISNTGTVPSGTLTRIESIKQTTLKKWGTKSIIPGFSDGGASNIDSVTSHEKSGNVREYFIPGISFPTIPAIYPLLGNTEHWV